MCDEKLTGPPALVSQTLGETGYDSASLAPDHALVTLHWTCFRARCHRQIYEMSTLDAVPHLSAITHNEPGSKSRGRFWIQADWVLATAPRSFGARPRGEDLWYFTGFALELKVAYTHEGFCMSH